MTLAEELATRLGIDATLCEPVVAAANKRLLLGEPNFIEFYWFLFFPCHCPEGKEQEFREVVSDIIKRRNDARTTLAKIDVWRVRIKQGCIEDRAFVTALTPYFVGSGKGTSEQIGERSEQ